MKAIRIILVFLVVGLVTTGCGKKQNTGTRGATTESMIEKIAEEQTETTTEETTEASTEETEAASTETAMEENTPGDANELLGEPDPNVDLDLTVLNPNMVYAEVFNIMSDPDAYLGKIIKVSGPYYPLYYDGTGNYYHYVMIQDALACCQNGMEFIWDEGAHSYPAEYPEKDQNIEISGVFKCYKEENITYYYLDIDEIIIIE